MIPTIIIADDHSIFKIGLIELINSFNDYKVISEFKNASKYDEITKETPIILVDLDMLDKNSLEICQKFKTINCESKIVILTYHLNEYIFKEFNALGVMGYINKGIPKTKILTCLKTVAAGQKYFSHPFNTLEPKGKKQSSIDQFQNSLIQELTETEKKVLACIAEGLTTNEISTMLFNSPHTIKNHRKNICRKLNIQGGNNSLLCFALGTRVLLRHYLSKYFVLTSN